MEKLKIAIAQGNYNGTSYELILRACEDPAMFELCTPIIYGSTKYALAFRKKWRGKIYFPISGKS